MTPASRHRAFGAARPHLPNRRRGAALAAAAALVLLAACAADRPLGEEGAAGPEVIRPPGASTIAAYSPAIRAGDFLFVSGTLGVRPGTVELVEGGTPAETGQALENIRGVLDAAGASLDDLVSCTVYLADIGDFARMNEVYASFFPADPPTRTTIGVAGLPIDARVEITCTAYQPRRR